MAQSQPVQDAPGGAHVPSSLLLRSHGHQDDSARTGAAAAAGKMLGAGGRPLTHQLSSLRQHLGEGGHIHWSQVERLRSLGHGSFADVSQCNFTPVPGGEKRAAAVKQIRTELLSDPQEVEVFVSEVKLLRTLRHRNIVAFYGCGWSKEAEEQDASGNAVRMRQLFFLQEYMPGGTLQQLVLKAATGQGWKVYSDRDVLRWALQIAQALEYLHSHKPKIIHRDLKLENILLTSGRPSRADAKLADFGLARLLQGTLANKGKSKSATWDRGATKQHSGLSRVSRSQTFDLERTKLNRLLSSRISDSDLRAAAKNQPAELTGQTGSLGYMAPEVLQGRVYNEKADVFSFGIVLYNLAHRNIPTLHIVYNGSMEDLEEYAHQVAHGFRPPISPKVPPGVATLIERCWKGLPELRPTMAEVVQELEGMQLAEDPLPTARGGGCSCCSVM